MSRSIVFYFAVPSRYSYLASTQMERLSAQTGHDIIWTPVDGEELRQRAGNDQFNSSALSGQYKSPYRERDLADWVDYYGVPYREPPDESGELWWRGFGWQKMRQIALAALAGQELGGDARWFHALFHLMFVGDRWPFTLDDLLDVARANGLDPHGVRARMGQPDLSDRLSHNTEQALADGVFGVPSFCWSGKMFFGNDRLVILKHQLSKLADQT